MNYGKVPSEEVKLKEAKVLNIAFHPTGYIVILYRPIDKLQNLATTAGIPYSQAQQLEFSLILIRNTRDFEKALGEWSAKPDADKTWDNFKTHFKETHTDLKEIRGPKI